MNSQYIANDSIVTSGGMMRGENNDNIYRFSYRSAANLNLRMMNA